MSSGFVSLGGGAAATLIGGAVTGGIGSAISGGSFWMGAQQGLNTAGLNHLGHLTSGDQGDPPKEGSKIYTPGRYGAILEYTCNACGEYEFSGLIPGSGASMVTDSPIEWLIGGGAVKSAFGKLFSSSPGRTFAQYKAARGGTETLREIVTSSGVQRISTEFHHAFISQRLQRAYNLPNWLVNNRINVWKLNTVQHSLIDPYRFNFLRASFKPQVGWFKKHNWFTQY